MNTDNVDLFRFQMNCFMTKSAFHTGDYTPTVGVIYPRYYDCLTRRNTLRSTLSLKSLCSRVIIASEAARVSTPPLEGGDMPPPSPYLLRHFQEVISSGTQAGKSHMIVPREVLLIVFCELAHFLFGVFSALAAGLLAYLSIWTIYHGGSIRSNWTSTRSISLDFTIAAICILLFSWSASLVSHVLEDYFLSWF